MESRAANYGARTVGWELAALATANSVIILAAAAFLYMIFRDASLIDRYSPGINTALYAETHTYIVLIEIVLWALMAKAAVRFKAYSRKIQHSPDGAALNHIADAMLLSLAYAILFDMASTFKTLFIQRPQLGLVTTITNLLPLAVFVTLSVLLFAGAHQLRRLVPDTIAQRQRRFRLVSLGLALYSLVIVPYVAYFYRMAPTLLDDDGLHHFALPPQSLLAVYIVPFSTAWLIGLLSCIDLAGYAGRVQGKLYRPGFRSLYHGILISYVSTYLVQIFYVSNVSSNRFGVGLVILVSFIALLIAGYGLMYRGANRLYILER